MLGGFTCDTTLPLQVTYPILMFTRYVILGLFLSWISNPEPSKNIGPLLPLFSWIHVLSSKSVCTFPYLDSISARKQQIPIQSSTVLFSSYEEENSHMMSNITPSQRERIYLFPFSQGIDPFSYLKWLLYFLSKLENIPYFLSIWEVNTISLIFCLYKSTSYQFFIDVYLPRFYLSHHIDLTSFQGIMVPSSLLNFVIGTRSPFLHITFICMIDEGRIFSLSKFQSDLLLNFRLSSCISTFQSQYGHILTS